MSMKMQDKEINTNTTVENITLYVGVDHPGLVTEGMQCSVLIDDIKLSIEDFKILVSYFNENNNSYEPDPNLEVILSKIKRAILQLSATMIYRAN